MSDTTQPLPDAPTYRIIKISDCPSLTGKSQLGYHISCYQSDYYIRIAFNTGGGYFNPDWCSLNAILSAIEKAPKPLTSFSLTPLFVGRSINTPSFLFAVLLANNLVKRDEENPRVYVTSPHADFIAELDSLKASDVSLQVPEHITSKGAVKNKRKILTAADVVKPKPRGRPSKSNAKPT